MLCNTDSLEASFVLLLSETREGPTRVSPDGHQRATEAGRFIRGIASGRHYSLRARRKSYYVDNARLENQDKRQGPGEAKRTRRRGASWA